MKLLAKFVFVLFIFCNSCEKANNYSKVSNDEIIELIKNNKIDFFNITYKDRHGEIPSDSIMQLFNKGKLARNFYKNKKGDIDQIRLTELNSTNKIFEIRVREMQQNPFDDISYVPLDCNESEQLYLRAFERDQRVRKDSKQFDSKTTEKEKNSKKELFEINQQIDKLNRDTLFSIIDLCSWPDTKEDAESLFYIVQHSGSGKIAYYFSRFEELVKSNLLEDSLMAKMEDRLLMYNGYPQVYGTQISPPAAFHQIEDVQNVNKRRKAVGLCSIEQKAKSLGFEFNIENHIK